MIRAVTERSRGNDIVLVANEITAGTRAGLIEGVVDLVVATPTRPLAEATIRTMLDAARRPATFIAAQIVLPFELHGPES